MPGILVPSKPRDFSPRGAGSLLFIMHYLRIAFVSTAAWAACFLIATGGCSSGPEKGEVRGKVTFKGQPVKEGTVTLLNPNEGGAYEATINSDGSFEVAGGAAVGEYVVEIKPLVVIVDTDPGKSPPAPVEKPAKDIPQKYRQQGSSPLRADVKAGKNDDFIFDMKP